MSDTTISRFFELVGWIFALNPDAFRVMSDLPQGFVLALLFAFLAGLSRGIGQAVILFINQVTPLRFIFSLLINAALFASGLLFLGLSTWLIIWLLPGVQVELESLAIALGFSCAPLLFSFLGAMPYLGVPLLSLLSVWFLLAMVVGVGAVVNVSISAAFSYVALGWIVLQVLQNTVGQPIATLGSRLASAIAGVDLVTQRRDVMNLVGDRLADASATWANEFRERVTEIRQLYREGIHPPSLSGVSDSSAPASDSSVPASDSSVPAADSQEPSLASLSQRSAATPSKQVWETTLKTMVGLLGIVILTVVVVVFLRPVREWLFAWHNQLPRLFQLMFNLAWIGIVGVAVAGVLAPLETLGWWAGWYEDDIDTTLHSGDLATPLNETQTQTISRYIVYLDGIGQSGFEYLPDIEEFLDALTPTLPADVALIRGIIPYSVLNNPLDEDRPLAFLWKAADKARVANPAAILGFLVNLRNTIIVSVSADKRYGPLYNQGITQVVYNGLLKNGYRPDSGIPITLIGFSGGGQMACACAPLLKRILNAPLEVISLAGVMSGNCDILQLEHLYHFVGDKDPVERLGPVLFPGRWPLFFLSFWNRAKRRGKISIFSMGPLGHQVPGGILDPNVILADGRSALQQTLDYIHQILNGTLLPQPDFSSVNPSNYERYRNAPFARPESYPLTPSAPGPHYQAIAPWIGRLILPQPHQRRWVRGVFFEIRHAPPEYQEWVGHRVVLRWQETPRVGRLVKAVTKDVHFSADASYTSQFGGLVHPDRLNHWQQVGPLESLAGSHPVDDVVVALDGLVQVVPNALDSTVQNGLWQEESRFPQTTEPDSSQNESPLLPAGLYIRRQPIQVTGQYYGLVRFICPVDLNQSDQAQPNQAQPNQAQPDQYRVAHFNRESRQFDGGEETVLLPPVVADENGCYPSTTHQIESSPLNETGWYIYGTPDAQGRFVVQAIAPRSLLRLQPERVVFGAKAAYRYIRQDTWDNISAQKGRIASVLCSPENDESSNAISQAIGRWQEGDRALLVHVYGGIGGNKREPAAAMPIFFGHFAFGQATVIRDPLADELRFDITYQQVYTHNTDGLIAGSLHWSRYMGDRQFGWLGVRPVCDLVIKLDSFTGTYEVDGKGEDRLARSPLSTMMVYLSAMTARYRIGDGTGGTYVGPANNCAQDSNQALFASLMDMGNALQLDADQLETWIADHPEQLPRLQQLSRLGRDLKHKLQLFGKPREDWVKNEFNLGSTLEDEPIRNLIMGIGSWRTLLPRKASDTLVKVFLHYGASVWVLRTNQVGGDDPDIEPIAPMTL
ncbi:MAG: hypothetical protein WBA57_10615 [Elainellaceae cyanobacterium]